MGLVRRFIRAEFNFQAKAYAASAAVIESLETRALLSAGMLDPTFGGSGIVLPHFADDNYAVSNGQAAALQSDGKIVVAGYVAQDLNDTAADFALARFNSDGTLDTTFGDHGTVATNLGRDQQEKDIGTALAILPDGKILVAGDYKIAGSDEFAVVRYNSDGSVDYTFGNHGLANAITGEVTYAKDIAVQPDGKIVVGGSILRATPTLQDDVALVRFNADGTLDDQFGNNGVMFYDGGGG